MTGAIDGSGDIVYDDGVLQIARVNAPHGLVLAGEADEAGYKPLVTALAQLADGGGASEVHIDLSGLQFCDAAALHAMIASAENGHSVVLHHPAPQLQLLIRIAGWDELPTLKVVTGQ